MSAPEKTLLALIAALVVGLLIFLAEEFLFDVLTEPGTQQSLAEELGITKANRTRPSD